MYPIGTELKLTKQQFIRLAKQGLAVKVKDQDTYFFYAPFHLQAESRYDGVQNYCYGESDLKPVEHIYGLWNILTSETLVVVRPANISLLKAKTCK